MARDVEKAVVALRPLRGADALADDRAGEALLQ